MVSIRRFSDRDLDVVVAFSVAAWEPVFASLQRVMGPDVFPLVYPDWTATQAEDVRAACQDTKNEVWVATGRLLPGALVPADSGDFGGCEFSDPGGMEIMRIGGICRAGRVRLVGSNG